MLTRRSFAGIASCAICAVTGFVASDASAAEGASPPVVPRHTHPGIESSYVLEGGFELPIQGQPIRMLKAGDGFQIPPETPHAGGKPGDKKTRIAITYVVEKDTAFERVVHAICCSAVAW